MTDKKKPGKANPIKPPKAGGKNGYPSGMKPPKKGKKR